MFNTHKKQFINILQQNKQLKINYKITEEDKILKEEQSTFLLTNEKLPEDAKFKINALQKDIKQTYITSLFETPNQMILDTNSVDVISYDSVKIGNNKSVVIPKNEINSLKNYFEDIGIDYIISPFTLLEEYLEDNGKKNSLNFLLYNDILYILIYNEKKQLAHNKIITLTPFESTQDESFSNDDIVGQKLYEEVNFLEIQQFLTEIVEEYYTANSNVDFLEHIEILYTLKPFSQSQVDALEEIMMIPIRYKAISLNNYIDEIVQRSDSKIHNFIIPRIKKEGKSIYFWGAIALATIFITVAIFYTQLQKPLTKEPQKIEKETQQQSLKKSSTPSATKQQEIETVRSTIPLPNHIQNNKMVLQNIQMLFDVIPYNAILKEIEINKTSSTYISNFLNNSNSLLDMQTKLKNIYSESKILLHHKNSIIENTIIQNDAIKTKYHFTQNIAAVPYKIYSFLSTSKATAYISGLVFSDSVIKFTSKQKNNYQTYNFSVISKIQSPKEFFDFIEKINTQKLSVELQYPFVFSQKKNYLEVKYSLQLHQQIEKPVHPIE